jgi:biotin synthase
MDRQTVEEIADLALSGRGITEPQALRIADCPREGLFDFLALGDRVRQKFHGVSVKLCGIINAKSGRCAEDCTFCAQSARHKTEIKKFNLITKNRIVATAKKAAREGVRDFSIVTSGRTLSEKELDRVAEAVAEIKALGLGACASLGILGPEALEMLAEAGLDKYHHNLETSRSFFPNICTTHSYEEDVQSVRAAKEAGLQVCSGGIFGLGESTRDWIELASTLRELDVDSVPLNFHNPIKGTKLGGRPLVPALDALRIILILRLVFPTKDVVVCGGREVTLRDLQCLMFPAGANGLMLGDYLTTKGRDPAFDIRMIKDLELVAAPKIKEDDSGRKSQGSD